MKKISLLMIACAFSIFALSSCSDDDDTGTTPTDTSALTLSFSGLQDLGDGYAYEGWIIVDGAPVSAGIFTVDSEGKPSKSSFDMDSETLAKATAYILTIEPSPDSDPNPSAVHILAGDMVEGSGTLTVGDSRALNTDFADATGGYILATPTDGPETNETSGVWWLDPAGPSAALTLPTLPAGWKYEGWVVVNGTPVSSGTFLMAAGADDSAPYSGTAMPAPPFPGEDFLMNAPTGVTFPFDISGGKVVVSVEPDPDNSPNPFVLKPLVADVPMGAADHTLYTMMNNASATNPTGMVKVEQTVVNE